MRRILAPITTALALALLAGCGGQSDTDRTPDASPAESASTRTADVADDDTDNQADDEADDEAPGNTEEAARKVVEEYQKYFAEGAGKAACALLSEEHQQQQIQDAAEFREDDPPSDCAGAMAVGLAFAKAFGYDASAASIVDVTVSGDTATVIEDEPDPFEDTAYTLTWTGSTWLITGEESAAEARADPSRWLANWCKVQPGMTVDEAVVLMGDVTGDFRGEGQSSPQVEWSKEPYSFTAFLDADDVIRQLQTNESQLGANDKAALNCEATRR